MKHQIKQRAVVRKITERAAGSEKRIAQPKTQAGAYLARRYRVAPAVADLIARLAGLGLDRETAR